MLIQQPCFVVLRSGAPCLSFDVLRDGEGEGREQFPLSMLLCAGTQADTALSNRYKPPDKLQKYCVFKVAAVITTIN